MWTELVTALPGMTIAGQPGSPGAVEEASRLLGQQLPDQLAAVLLETGGVQGEYLELIWPIERVIAENLALRGDDDLARLYMPFDPLLFFGDAGNGDLFALVPHTSRPDVFGRDHENDSRTWVAPDLAKYLEWWQTGRIRL